MTTMTAWLVAVAWAWNTEPMVAARFEVWQAIGLLCVAPGMTRTQVQALTGGPTVGFTNGPIGESVTCDDYYFHHLHSFSVQVMYGPDWKVASITVQRCRFW